jgi:hypothetical protein
MIWPTGPTGTASAKDHLLCLQEAVSTAIARADWQRAATALEEQGDALRRLGAGVELVSYTRAARIARRNRLEFADRMAAKAAAARRARRLKGRPLM